MLENLHIKVTAFLLAVLLWVVIVSTENRFYELPTEVPVQIFNQAETVALAGKVPGVQLALRAADPLLVAKLSPQDFDAYIDLRDVGVGHRKVPVSVTSKNPLVSIFKVEPREVEIDLEPVRKKLVRLTQKVSGAPAKGFRLESVALQPPVVNVSGAESILKKIARADAVLRLSGSEQLSVNVPNVHVIFYDAAGQLIEGVTIEGDVGALLTIVGTQTTRELSIKAVMSGSVLKGVLKSVVVEPAVINLVGEKAVLDALSVIPTEEISVKTANVSFSKMVKLVLPPGVSVAPGSPTEVKVQVNIE